MVVAMSSNRAASAAPMSRRYLARTSTGVVDQVSNAVLAAAVAASTSAAVPRGTRPMTSSVAEWITSVVPLALTGATHCPPM